MAAVVAAYGATVALLPRVDVPVGDDWVYARTVERFLDGDGFRILDATVVTLALQALWGAAVSAVLGFGYVALRLSTLSLAAVGAVGLYGLCRALGASRQWSALAAAAWLFNPLAYVLANSYMSDASFAGLMVVATCLYVRGLGAATGSCPGWWWPARPWPRPPSSSGSRVRSSRPRSSRTSSSPAGPGSTVAACAPSPG